MQDQPARTEEPLIEGNRPQDVSGQRSRLGLSPEYAGLTVQKDEERRSSGVGPSGVGGQAVIRFEADRRARFDPFVRRSLSFSVDILGEDGKIPCWCGSAPLVDGYRKGSDGGLFGLRSGCGRQQFEVSARAGSCKRLGARVRGTAFTTEG